MLFEVLIYLNQKNFLSNKCYSDKQMPFIQILKLNFFYEIFNSWFHTNFLLLGDKRLFCNEVSSVSGAITSYCLLVNR